MRKFYFALLAALIFAAAPNRATAGFIIIDGTDANDHGFAAGGVNVDGWEYMQRVLENLAAARLAGNPAAPRTVYNVGADVGSQSGNAIASAFNLSSLPGNGWTLTNVTGAAPINALLSSLDANVHGILAFTTAGNSGGDLDQAEVAAINMNAASINNYLGGGALGGALHAMAQSDTIGSNGYLTTLLPGFVATDVGGGGIATDITLTAAGMAAFPGLSNADLAGADPWHNHFSGNLGGLQVLGVAPDLAGVSRNLIVGNVGGTITQPPPTGNPVPVPATAVALLAGLPVFGLLRRKTAKA